MSYSCAEWRGEIGAYIVGALDERAGARLLRHLAVCPGCRADYDDLVPVQAMLGALDGPAKSNVVVWNSVTPRVGLTYALNESRKTILRASYAMFASQLLDYLRETVLGGSGAEDDEALVSSPKVGEYLQRAIFAPGQRLRWDALIEQATGEALSPARFVAHISEPA